MNEIIWCLSFSDWLISLSIVLLWVYKAHLYQDTSFKNIFVSHAVLDYQALGCQAPNINPLAGPVLLKVPGETRGPRSRPMHSLALCFPPNLLSPLFFFSCYYKRSRWQRKGLLWGSDTGDSRLVGLARVLTERTYGRVEADSSPVP